MPVHFYDTVVNTKPGKVERYHGFHLGLTFFTKDNKPKGIHDMEERVN